MQLRDNIETAKGVKNMVNGRTLEDELRQIDLFFDSMDLEQFEKMVFECGAGEILPSEESIYVKAVPKRYANLESKKKYCPKSVFDMTFSGTEAA